jgi:hypothetical protein
MMENLFDFQNELTLLQHIAAAMFSNIAICITVERTPICHPELAGEGIEYSWGCAKQTYRNLPIEKKRGVKNFCNSSVSHCLSKAALLVECIQKFFCCARRYILVYYVFENMKELGETNDNILDEISFFIRGEGKSITPQ